jgi:hypothetical protein
VSAPRLVVLALVLGTAACGGPTPAPVAAPPRDADGGADAGHVVADTLPSLAALAGRGPSDAPLMREVLRVEQAAPRSPEVRADRDLCVRALFAASAPARVWLADGAGAARGEIARGTSGAAPPQGPACVRKGEALHLVVEGEGPLTARAVLFAAP